jgi:hypothetical protein
MCLKCYEWANSNSMVHAGVRDKFGEVRHSNLTMQHLMGRQKGDN